MPAAPKAPTEEQLKALNAFAVVHGRQWKTKLRSLWQSGNWRNVAGSGHLQSIRNTFGPQYLTRFKASPQ